MGDATDYVPRTPAGTPEARGTEEVWGLSPLRLARRALNAARQERGEKGAEVNGLYEASKSTRDLALAITHLEDAVLRLRLYNGFMDPL